MTGLCWNHTYSVQDGQNQCVAKCCSFQTTALKEGKRCTLHKGKLLLPVESKDVVVKAFHDQNLNSDSTEVQAEMDKYNFVLKVLRECSGSTAKTLLPVCTFQTQVEKVGKGSKLKKRVSKGRHHVNKDDSVVVQDFVDGEIRVLFSLTYSRTPPRQTSATLGLPCLLELVKKSYSLSQGRCVIGVIKGAVHQDLNGAGVTYHLTSLTVHSRGQTFGDKDLGVYGVEMYELWSGLAPRLPASAPPLEVFTEDEESSQRDRSRNVFLWPTSPPQPSACGVDGIPQPPTSLSSVSCWEPNRSQTGKAPTVHQVRSATDCVDSGPEAPAPPRRRTLADLLATTPELRNHCPAWLVNSMLGPAPAYSFSETFS